MCFMCVVTGVSVPFDWRNLWDRLVQHSLPRLGRAWMMGVVVGIGVLRVWLVVSRWRHFRVLLLLLGHTKRLVMLSH